tara:strand:- start:620 stop:1420 length:801 start_codon:yes stop_codon:yes gene_type:complete
MITMTSRETIEEAHNAHHPSEGGWLADGSALEKLYFSLDDGGPHTSKWSHAFDVYERHLARFRGTDVVLLEIGINHGGSMRLWREYFGPRATIMGADVFDSSFMQGNPLYGSPNITFIGNETHNPRHTAWWEQLRRLVPRLDVLIDDGGHTANLQKQSLTMGVPMLHPGGVYLCEDIGDFSEKGSIVRLAAQQYLLGEDGFYPFKWGRGMTKQKRLTWVQRELFSMSAYPHMLVVERLTRPRNRINHKGVGNITKTGKRPKGTHMG